ncbi:type 1 periplasmic binding fold superfamily protein [Winogradskyella vidalii]|uniref:type 1 periplasmic binding fold superfamily protein n=1 Tax=Winogradskyella vidalii TaxID=2615024 RepID=UPI0015CB94DA|nr:type 1 periplasmic binding fold superfamily protein [Winogradskyella vidalii]
MPSLFRNVFLFTSIIILSACSSDDRNDDSETVNEIEFITTSIVTMTPTDTSLEPIVLYKYDQDGWNGNQHSGEDDVTGAFVANMTYNCSVQLLNENVSPPEDLTSEIINEGTDHIFIFSPTEASNIQIAYASPFDINNKPIGTNFTLTTGNSGCVQLMLRLLHKPNKDDPGIENGTYSDLNNMVLDVSSSHLANCY